MEEYTTPDIYLSATLITAGGILKEINPKPSEKGQKAFFVIEIENAQEKVKEFYSGELKQSALLLLQTLKALKSKMYKIFDNK